MEPEYCAAPSTAQRFFNSSYIIYSSSVTLPPRNIFLTITAQVYASVELNAGWVSLHEKQHKFCKKNWHSKSEGHISYKLDLAQFFSCLLNYY